MKSYIFIGLFALLIAGCALDAYTRGITSIDEIHTKHQLNWVTFPETMDDVRTVQAEFEALKQGNTDESIALLLNYRTELLEANYYELDGFKWGQASTTKLGFGCRKGKERILNSTALRNQSAVHGYAAADYLEEFIVQFPEKSKDLKLGNTTLQSIRAAFDEMVQQVNVDIKRYNAHCNKEE